MCILTGHVWTSVLSTPHYTHTMHTHRDRDSKGPIDARSGKITEFTIKGFERYIRTVMTHILQYHLFPYSFFHNVVVSDDYIGRAFLPLSDITHNGGEKILKLESHSGHHDDRGMLHVLLNIESEQRNLRDHDVSSRSQCEQWVSALHCMELLIMMSIEYMLLQYSLEYFTVTVLFVLHI